MTDIDKSVVLREEGLLHPRPEEVTDPRFREGDFFDPRDQVQVKYEMLRRVRVERISVTQAVAEFGFSRPTYYTARANFEQSGIAGLVPRKRGPKGPHKLQGDVLDFLQAQVVPGQPLRARLLAKLIRQEFGLDIHPRTIERTLRPPKKRAH